MKNEAIATAPKKAADEAIYPAFVEAEKLLDRIAEITMLTSQKAYEYFLSRRHEFGTHFDDWLKAEMEVLRPTPVEVSETADNLNIRAAVPGFKPDEIEISVKDALLIMSGETKSAEKAEDEKTFLNEWRSNRFCRQIELPSEVETGGVKATLANGILNLTLKKKAAKEAEKINVIAA